MPKAKKNTANYNVWDLLLRFPGGWRKEGVLK